MDGERLTRSTVSHSRDFASFPASSFILSLCFVSDVVGDDDAMMNVSGRNLNINIK